LKFAETVRVIEPVPYLEMITLESNAKLILTDSGGIQKEAYCLNVPCVTLREETEWVETVETGGNILAGADKDRIIKSGNFIIDSRFKNSSSVYGDGNAAKRVLNILFDFLPQE
jgi:UDP-N-acetylglucosamine 2-epimerase